MGEHFMSNKIIMGPRMSQFPEVLVSGPHSTIHPTVFNVKIIFNEMKILTTLLTFPNLLKLLFRQIPVTKSLVLKIGTAPIDIATRHDVGPKKWR